MSEPLRMATKLPFEKVPAGEIVTGDHIRFGTRDLELWAEVRYVIERGPKTVELVLRSATEGVSLGPFGEHRQTCRKATLLGVRRGGGS